MICPAFPFHSHLLNLTSRKEKYCHAMCIDVETSQFSSFGDRVQVLHQQRCSISLRQYVCVLFLVCHDIRPYHTSPFFHSLFFFLPSLLQDRNNKFSKWKYWKPTHTFFFPDLKSNQITSLYCILHIL